VPSGFLRRRTPVWQTRALRSRAFIHNRRVRDLSLLMELSNLTFEQLLRHVFNHELQDPKWHFQMDTEYWSGPTRVTVSYLTQLFNDPVNAVQGYSDAQVDQGLWYLISSAASNHMFALRDDSVPLVDQVACIRAMSSLYEKLFAARCTPHLGHLNDSGANPLNMTCYMWWDLMPLVPSPDSLRLRNFDTAILEVMEKALALPSIACQESALHGLGHWQYGYPQLIGSIIDDYLSQPDISEHLSEYALQAKFGRVL
jgi:hypothetical protein